MNDRALIRVGAAGAVLVAICCAAPPLAVSLPLAGLGAWLAGAGLVMLPLMVAALGLVAWASIIAEQQAQAVRPRFARKA